MIHGESLLILVRRLIQKAMRSFLTFIMMGPFIFHPMDILEWAASIFLKPAKISQENGTLKT